MRRAILVLTVVLALAPAAGAATKTGFAFGRSGGNIMPFTVSIATSGKVTRSGAAPIGRTTLTKLQMANLNRMAVTVEFETLPAVTACQGTLPDVAAEWIRVGARTVRVHGSCVARFNRLWAALSKATS